MTRVFKRVPRIIGNWFESDQLRNLSRRVPLGVAELEDRRVPATFVVLNDGTGADLAAQIGLLNASVDPTNTLDLFTNFKTPSTLALTAPLPAIAVPVNVIGGQSAGLNTVTISGESAVSIFDVSAAPTGTAISFQKLNLTKGLGAGFGLSGFGGVLTIDDETVTISNSVVSASTAECGGGVFMRGSGILNVTDSTITGNSATSTVGSFRGGAAFYSRLEGTLNVTRSTISGNKAARGGAIMMYYQGAVSVVDSTLSGNTSQAQAGAIYTFNPLSSFVVRNSTFSGNSAAFSGGAITLINAANTVTVQNSTFTQNTASSSSDGGGGIALIGGSATLNLSSNIFTANLHTGGNASHDLRIAATNTVNATKNAIGSKNGFALATDTGNIYGSTNLQLDPTLKNNGGATFTHAILGISSAAVDTGENIGTPTLVNDQRGPGFSRSVGAGVDMGAFEFKTPTVPTALASASNITTLVGGGSTTQTITVTYNAPTGQTITTGTLDNNDITITGPGGSVPGTFVSSNSGQIVTAIYTITAPGGTWDFADNGTYSIAMVGNQVKASGGGFVAAGNLTSFTVAVGKTYVVDNPTDSAVVGKLTLRQAFQSATADTPGALDIINFDAAVFALPTSISVDTPLSITSDVIANAPAARITFTSTTAGDSVLTVNDASNATTTASLSNLAFTGGTGASGGGIYSGPNDVLTLTNCLITGNSSSNGGGIYIDASGTLNLIGSTISGNTSTGTGGGVYFYSGGNLNVLNSTVSGNQATEGGGLYFFGNGASVRVVNSTVSGNSATSAGAGIGLRGGTTTNLQIINSTITNNTADGDGGGIGRINGTGTITLTSSIVSGNSAATNPDIGTVNVNSVTSTFSAVGVDPGASWNANNNLPAAKNLAFGAVLNLGVLTNNGGPTETHALGTGSAAINAGSTSPGVTPATDQRGSGFNRVSGSSADIGAFEVQATATPVVSGIEVNGSPLVNTQRSRLTQIIVTFTNAVDLAQFQTPGAVFLTRIGVATNNIEPNGTVVNNTNGLIISPASGTGTIITLTFQNIDNAGIDNASLSDGRWSLSVVPAGYVANAGNTGNQLRRLFGDIDNNGTVDATDFGAFPPFGNAVNNPFDFDNNGTIDGSDFAAFGGRNGYSLT